MLYSFRPGDPGYTVRRWHDQFANAAQGSI